MVNIFKSYKFLYTLTTAAVSFFPIMVVSASPNTSGTSCDSKAKFYTCSDGKKHELKDKTYHLPNASQDKSVSAIHVRKKGTTVKASQITVMGDNPSKISQYGALVQESGKLVLTDSNFKDIPGLRAQNGVIQMTRGKIEGTSHAIYASGKETDIALISVNVEIKPDNLNAKDIGIVSGLGAFVRMSGGTVTFNEIGAFLTRFGGRYLLDNMDIKGKGKKYTVIVDNRSIGKLPGAFDVFQGGNVHLRNNSLQLTDMHGFLIKNFSAFVNSRGQPIQNYDLSDVFKKTNIEIERSNISVQGKEGYGLYFSLLDPNTVAEYYGKKGTSKMPSIIMGGASVHLKQTDFTVPDGTAIYATGQDGYGVSASLHLSEATKISGDLLLKVEKNSSISIKAHASSLKGGIRVEKTANAVLQLAHGSTWFLTKRKYEDLQESDSIGSSISSVSLSDSTLIFNQGVSSGYQTLHIGSERYREVYNAEGNVQIKLSTFLNDDGLFDSQKTDRILIDGDVSGTTLLVMENFYKASEREASSQGSNSISLVQVSGKAKEDSFKLINNYTTVNGLPYQYHLCGYGPASSRGKANSENRLVAGRRDFWDFRLEAVYIVPKTVSSETLPVPPFPSEPVEPSSPDSVPDLPTPVPLSPSAPIAPTPTPSVPSDVSDPISTDPSPSSSAPIAPTPTPSVPSDVSDPISTDPSPSSSVLITPTPTSSVPSDVSDPISTDPSPSSSVLITPTPTPSVPSDVSDPISTDPSPSSSAPITPTPAPFVPPDLSEPAPQDSAPTPPSPSVSPTPSPSVPSDPSEPAPTPPVLIKPDIHPEPRIRAVVPQLPTYLLLPNTLFHTGLLDLTTQNKKLEAMRSVSRNSLKSDENSAFFIRVYGGSHHYTSNLSAFEYGYGAELDYTALEAGVLLKEIESLYSRTFFGVMGTYGNLSLHPLNVEQSKKSPFDKWSVSAYGSLQHDTGFYMDGLLSYGLFRGDVFTLARGKAATLKGKQLSTSLTSGKTFTIGHNGVVFDPRVQLVYQHLQFDCVRDVDNLDVDMGKFHQWTARFGGRLTKMFAGSEEGRVISFYSKLYLLHSFGERQFVSFKKDFQLGAFGSSLEAGFGFNTRLSAKFVLHGDINYQHRLTKGGFSGISFSGKLHYNF